MTNEQADALLRQASGGDSEALYTIYKEFRDVVYHFALSIVGDPEDAKDVLQDTFIRLRQGGYRTGNAKAYLFAVARNAAVSVLRRRHSDCELNEELSSGREGALEQRVELGEALASLSPEERRIVLLHVIAGLRHREISSLLGRPLGTVLWKYQSAIKKLRSFTEERSDIHEPEGDLSSDKT